MINQTPLNWQAPDKELMQEMLDRGVAGILGQGGFSHTADLSSNGKCLYRSEEGNACALGHCFTDAELDKFEEVSGHTPDELSESGAFAILSEARVWGKISNPVKRFAIDLQDCHDSVARQAGKPLSKRLSQFKKLAKELAESSQLTVPAELTD